VESGLDAAKIIRLGADGDSGGRTQNRSSITAAEKDTALRDLPSDDTHCCLHACLAPRMKAVAWLVGLFNEGAWLASWFKLSAQLRQQRQRQK